METCSSAHLSISDEQNRDIAQDILLDEYLLNRALTELDERIFDNAKLLYAALKQIAAYDIDNFEGNDAEHDALYEAIEQPGTLSPK